MWAGELAALIGVEDFGLPRLQNAAQHLLAELAIECVREFPLQHVTATPIEYGHQSDPALVQPDVSDVAAPHLIDALDSHAA